MEGLSKSMIPPADFRFRIESFSWLSTCSVDRFESCEFDAGGYKWKLALYPNGNKKMNGEDHISLYLVLVDNSYFDVNKEILVSFSLFVFNHIQDKYLSVQCISHFHEFKSESGFDKFLSLKVFSDPSNGYLVDDTCMFGAKVLFTESTTKEQCLSVDKMKNVPFKYTWKIEKFSGLEEECYYSQAFTTGGHDWKMLVYPKGTQTGMGKYLSLFLALADPDKLSSGMEVTVEYRLRVLDQVNKKHRENVFTKNFGSSGGGFGLPKTLPLSDLNRATGYSVNDTCIVEAEITVLE